jgi:hypothetical protein
MFGTQHFDKKTKSIVSNEFKIFATKFLFSLISQLWFETEQ